MTDLTSSTLDCENKSRGKNKDQFVVRTNGFQTFNLYYNEFKEKQGSH